VAEGFVVAGGEAGAEVFGREALEAIDIGNEGTEKGTEGAGRVLEVAKGGEALGFGGGGDAEDVLVDLGPIEVDDVAGAGAEVGLGGEFDLVRECVEAGLLVLGEGLAAFEDFDDFVVPGVDAGGGFGEGPGGLGEEVAEAGGGGLDGIAGGGVEDGSGVGVEFVEALIEEVPADGEAEGDEESAG